MESASKVLPREIANEVFLQAECETVVLANGMAFLLAAALLDGSR